MQFSYKNYWQLVCSDIKFKSIVKAMPLTILTSLRMSPWYLVDVSPVRHLTTSGVHFVQLSWPGVTAVQLRLR